MHDRPDPHRIDGFGQILTFRRRRAPASLHSPLPDDPDTLAVDDLAQYEKDRDDEPVDYRRRALMNVIAIAVITILVGAGVWIADTITVLERDQDCVIQGRSNCAPIELPAPKE